MTQPPLPLPVARPAVGTIRQARVRSHGAGTRPQTFRVDGLDTDILVPSNDLPPVGATVTLRLTETGWALA